MEERTLRSILKRMNLSITVHGFRSTFRDWCGDRTNFARWGMAWNVRTDGRMRWTKEG
jgi:hypothetical protein